MASLKVTPSHRVMVQRGTSPQTMPARGLRLGDLVYCSGGTLQPLVDIRQSSKEVSVVMVTFEPDEAVEAFYPTQPSILSKGHGHPKTTRRSKRRSNTDLASIPETDDGFR